MWNPLKEKHLVFLPEEISKKIESDSKTEVDLVVHDIKLNIIELLQNVKNFSWNVLEIFTIHLNDSRRKSHIFLQLYYSKCLIPQKNLIKLSLVLWSIVLSQNLQRQGIGSLILKSLEDKCKIDDVYFVIMGITSNSMQNLCIKRNYKDRGSFSMYCYMGDSNQKSFCLNKPELTIPITKPFYFKGGQSTGLL